jgi:hypothetical protein
MSHSRTLLRRLPGFALSQSVPPPRPNQRPLLEQVCTLTALRLLSYRLLGKSGTTKNKKQDPAPGSLSIKKELVLATPNPNTKSRKPKPKDEDTSSDDEEVPSSDLSENEDGAEATDEFATVIRGPPTVTDGDDNAGKTHI